MGRGAHASDISCEMFDRKDKKTFEEVQLAQAPLQPRSPKPCLVCPLLSCDSTGTQPSDPVYVMVATDFEIELVFINNGTPSQDAAFASAADRWMDLLGGGLDDVDFLSNPVTADLCLQGQPAISSTITDLRIYIDIKPIDGPLGTLGQAGPCQIRNSSQLPVIGFLQLDSDDVMRLEQDGDLMDVILHEMGHALGIGTLWSNFDTLLVNPSIRPTPVSTPTLQARVRLPHSMRLEARRTREEQAFLSKIKPWKALPMPTGENPFFGSN